MYPSRGLGGTPSASEVYNELVDLDLEDERILKEALEIFIGSGVTAIVLVDELEKLGVERSKTLALLQTIYTTAADSLTEKL